MCAKDPLTLIGIAHFPLFRKWGPPPHLHFLSYCFELFEDTCTFDALVKIDFDFLVFDYFSNLSLTLVYFCYIFLLSIVSNVYFCTVIFF